MMAAAAFALALAGCASAPQTEIKPDPVTQAVEQPFRDLNVVHHDPAAVVSRAAASPYAPPGDESCIQLALDIVTLNQQLGPDLDSPQHHHLTPDDFVGEAVNGAFRLPFRGIVRDVTGAAEHDRLLNEIVTAAVARRGYLRGVAAERRCDLSPPPDPPY